MPTYRQQWTYYEDGFGQVTDVFVVSDTYAGLFTATFLDVNVFEIKSTKHDLDIAGGTFVADELELDLLGEAAETADDIAAITFVLAARDPAVKRYCARLLNPTTPPYQSVDVEFRGVVEPNMDADDLLWFGATYGSSPAPLRNWKVTAYSFDTRSILDVDLKATVATMDADAGWKSSNIRDRLAHFKDAPRSEVNYHRELRHCDLINIENLLAKVFAVIAPPGITLGFVNSWTDFWVQPSHFYCTVADEYDNIPIRFNTFREGVGPDAPWYPGTPQQLKLFSLTSYDGCLFVDWKLLKPPTKLQESGSWVGHYETVGEWLYAMAVAFGMYIEFEYSNNTTIDFRFKPRSGIIQSAVYLCDAEKAGLKLSTEDPNSDRQLFSGNAWHLCREGPTQYNHDGGGLSVKEESSRPESGGMWLPLTVSPTYCLLEHRGNDIGEDADDDLAGWIIPHNAAIYDSDHGGAESTLHERGNGTDPQDSTRGVHTAMYINATGPAELTRPPASEIHWTSVGVNGIQTYVPVFAVFTKRNGTEYYFQTMKEYCEWLYAEDDAFFKAELSLTSPYLCRFRTAPAGADDWKNLKIGSQYTQDGIAYTVVGIERGSAKSPKTELRLHASSRFAFTVPGTPPISPPPDGYDGTSPAVGQDLVRYAYGTSAAIAVGDAVVKLPSGQVRRMLAYHSDEKMFFGIALDDKPFEAENNRLRVQIGGRVSYPADFGATTGARAYVRDDGIGTTNISHSPLTDKTGTEDLFADLGIWESNSVLKLETPTIWVHYPPLP